MDNAGEKEQPTLFRAPRSSLAVGRRFRLLARGPLPGTGTRPPAPTGFRSLGRDPTGLAAPESPHERFLLLPLPSNTNPRDLAWAEARFCADLAAGHSLLLSMLLPTETAPERKKQAQRLHDQATRLQRRVDALGPVGVGDPRAFAADVRSAVQPVVDFAMACQEAQGKGQLLSLAWPSLFAHIRRELSATASRMEAFAAGSSGGSAPEAAALVAQGRDLAEHCTYVARLIDPEERAWIERAQALGLRCSAPLMEVPAALSAAEAAMQFHADVCREVEAGRLRGALMPWMAEQMRVEAVKLADGLRRCDAMRAGTS